MHQCLTKNKQNFSWFLNKIVQEGRNVCQPNKTLLRRENLPYHVHLFVAFILFLVAIVIGSVYLNACSNERMISVFLIVQGACGLFIVLVHIAAAIVHHNAIICPFRLPTNVVKCVFAFTYCLVTFSIIWFVFGHAWIMKSKNTFQDGQICKTSASKFIIIILFYEYIVGIWYVGSRVWNDPSILTLLQNILQRRLHQLRPSIVLQIIDTSGDELDEVSIAQQPVPLANIRNAIQTSHIGCIVYIVIGLILGGVLLILIKVALVAPSIMVIPTQCSTYTTITDSTRRVSSTSCCQNDYNYESGWYRFTGEGGTQLVTTPLHQNNICSSSYPGWWNGTLPMEAGSSNVGKVCFYEGSSSCDSSISPIIATNCGNYYVFYLLRIQCCSSRRYCTT
ncbi:unnamed protein product [Adineta ricciae]|uniref:Uncharacterized protein n=1 Tax=Adineta ricciae TaxID=249248 RepID=A0A814MB84_ADIRI|nr:unnamed protein product [Adineta ricciae]